MRTKGPKRPIRKAQGVSAAVFLIVLISALGRSSVPGHAQSEQIAQSGPIVLVPSNSGTQDQTAGTKIIAPKLPPRSVDDHFRDFVRKNLTDKSVPVVTMVLIGDDQDERTDLADRIEIFLRSAGYIVRPRRYFSAEGGPLPKGIMVDNKSNPATIKIGANVGNDQ